MLDSIDCFCRIFMCSKVIDMGAVHKNSNDLSACR
jgi:hypothetical protein